MGPHLKFAVKYWQPFPFLAGIMGPRLTLDLASKRGPTHGWLNLDNLFDNWRLRIPAKNVLLSAEGASRNIWQTGSVFASSQILIWWISFLVILVDIWSGWTNLEANQALNILIPQMTTARGFCLIEAAATWSVLVSDWSIKTLIGSYWLILATVHSAGLCANFLVISQIMQALLQIFSGLCGGVQRRSARAPCFPHLVITWHWPWPPPVIRGRYFFD